MKSLFHEALANAVYHKAYDEREPIEVRITHDMIEIISHPGPDRSVTLQGLKEFKVYSRRYRNRRIGDFLKDLHLTEGRNTGFRKILDAIKANGSPLPEFETDEAHDYFVSRFFIHEGFYDNFKEAFSGNLGDDSANAIVKSSKNETSSGENETSLKQVLKQVLKQADYDKLLPIISHVELTGQISVQEVMEISGKSRSTAWRYLKMLVDAGVADATGETNNSVYILKPQYMYPTD